MKKLITRAIIALLIAMIAWTAFAQTTKSEQTTINQEKVEEEPEVINVEDLSVYEYTQYVTENMFGPSTFQDLEILIKYEVCGKIRGTHVPRDCDWTKRNHAQNPDSTAYGIGQFLNSTWETVGCEKTSNPKRQIDCMVDYIDQRYDGPDDAVSFHIENNWY